MLKEKIQEADVVVIGAGSGLSTSAGYTYTGKRFEDYFFDFIQKYGFRDMYSGGFYNFPTLEEHWAYWSRYIYINRYVNIPNDLYTNLYNLVKGKNYFVITTNVDHCFQRAGFDKKRLFYTQGDYGLFQCSEPCHSVTYDNEEIIKKMILAQGFQIKEDGSLMIPNKLKMEIPSELIPTCPRCGKPMSMNLRADDTFVEDEGWEEAANRCESFMQQNKNKKIVFLELGVGYNTPGIIKYPFWKMTYQLDDAFFVSINRGEAIVPDQIKNKSLCIDNDIYKVIKENL